MKPIKITVDKKDFLESMNNMIEITQKFNPQRLNSSYLSANLVPLVLKSTSTEFIYLRKSETIFNLSIYSNSQLINYLDVPVGSVSAFYSELLGTDLFNTRSNTTYIDVINAKSMNLSFNSRDDLWTISISVETKLN